ncbi:MAG: DUF1501 domain-containing protein [Candidatus Solibacter usitatus]|nr:DUF1501 domain-containing protein [Candidatus Solibacter usitatus]
MKKGFVSRRDWLFQAGNGMGSVALAALLNQQGLLGATACGAPGDLQTPFSPRKSHFAPRAKAVISMFMSGGVSQMDTFDPKPGLLKYAGHPLSGKGDVVVRQGHPGPLMPTPFTFKQYGQSGMPVSEIFPNIARHVDDMAFIRSVVGRSNDHVMAAYELATGTVRMGSPSVGAWVTYGLGSENQNLPAYVVIYDARGGPFGGPANWTAGYMPAVFQGTIFRSAGDPIVDLKPPPSVTAEQQRSRLDLLGKLNALDEAGNPGNSELSARINSYELAYRMQGCAPEAVDMANEPESTKKLYGLDNATTEPFGRQCLMARRLVERGVRFIQLYHGGLGNQNTDTWDAHDDVRSNHTKHALEVDHPIAGLLTDLKSRGLLDSTLVIFQSEFGRMPISQRGVGRDHNPGTMTIFMAGAKIKGGQAIGESDEFGYKAAVQPVSVHDLHATILHLLGMDHTRLTYAYQGRQMRLTDVYGVAVPQIVA